LALHETFHALGDRPLSVASIWHCALFKGVLGLAWRYGWHGTAVGGMVASIALATTAPGQLADPATLQVQSILALVVSGSLLVGARATVRRP
jgi:two-component system sensor histidine kinase UhpB